MAAESNPCKKFAGRPKGRFPLAEAKKGNYLKGAAILAVTVAITKVIGAIYKIPLYNILGDEGTTHFQFTYTIYSLLLTFSTAGVPVAIGFVVYVLAAIALKVVTREDCLLLPKGEKIAKLLKL